MAKRKLRHGLCKLTGETGKFVDSHLLPKALTRADGLGPGLMQLGLGRVQRRFSSWYDPALVTEEGEAILADYDSSAISILRKYRMVWSGWGPMQALADVISLPETPWGIRKIEFEDKEEPRRLRLFLLSILWRAAATTRPEFSEIELPSDQLDLLRKMVLTGDTEPEDFYPTSLTQLSTLGVPHNHTPFASTKSIPAVGEHPASEEPFFRFFLDGLIIHYSRLSIKENAAKDLGDLRVGQQHLTISTVAYEDSAQAENLGIVFAESALDRPLFELPCGPFQRHSRLR